MGWSAPVRHEAVRSEPRGGTRFRSDQDLPGGEGRPVKFWTVYAYLIVYDPASKPVQILRVIHAMRNVAELLT